MAKVHNQKAKTADENAVYVGRGTPWGNPFIIGVHGDRTAVLKQYREFIEKRPDLQEKMRAQLAGKDLVCHCAPEPCHADYILRIANNMLPAPEKENVHRMSRLLDVGDYASIDWDCNGKWQDVSIVERTQGHRSQSGIMVQVTPAPRNSDGLIDIEWLHPCRAQTQWYTHAESSCVFLDRPGEEHDQHSMACDIDEARAAVEAGYSISAIHSALLYASHTKGE